MNFHCLFPILSLRLNKVDVLWDCLLDHTLGRNKGRPFVHLLVCLVIQNTVLRIRGKVLAAVGWGVASVRRGWACLMLDTAGSSQFQPALTDLPQGRAEPRTGRVRSKGERKNEKQSCGHQGQRKRGRGAPGTRAEIPLQPTVQQVRISWRNSDSWRAQTGAGLQDYRLLRGPIQEQRKVWGGGSSKDWPQAPISHPLGFVG